MHPYLNYYFSALTKYQVHAPFVYEFLSDIFEDDRFYHYMGFTENYRRNLLASGDKILVNQQSKTIKQLVQNLSIKPSVGEVLFKTVHKYKPATLLELGDSLGIAALYQATPDPAVPLIALVPDKTLASTTNNYFKRLGTRNIQLIVGNITKTLPAALQQLNIVDHLFFNGFWGKAATLSYFETCLRQMPSNGVFIFRAPYTSKETQAFWETAKRHEKVRLSINIYDLGFLFFRVEQKQVAHYQIIESWKKPWAIF